MATSSTNTVIDLTREPEDHLTRLPPELLHLIISYLFPVHDAHLDPRKTTPRPIPPVANLALSCKLLYTETNNWALHFLKQHASITHYKDVKTEKLQMKRTFLGGSRGVLTWAGKHCVFCGQRSSRKAILMNGLRCCAACDRLEWPEKMTRTQAKSQFRLKDYQLQPHLYQPPADRKLICGPLGKLPTLRYGTYMTSNVVATMFLRHEVEALAKLIPGSFRREIPGKKAEKAS